LFVSKSSDLEYGAGFPAIDGGQAMAKTNPFQFLQQVRSETSKVTWPTRRETVTTAVMVFIFAIAASIFFMISDFVLKQAVGLLLGLGH
jgi:preprotein translocase subunit SecE